MEITTLQKLITGLVMLKINFERLTRAQIKAKIDDLLEETESKKNEVKKCNSNLNG